jgi:SPP1 family predicted phage head-tail adaptor
MIIWQQGKNSGNLRHRVTFQRLTEATNEVGETIQKLQDYRTVWAAIEPVTGREYYEAQKMQPELTYKITIRYLPDITPSMLIKYKDRLFQINDIINPDERNFTLQLMCIEKITKK